MLTAANRPLFGLRDFEVGQPYRRNEDDDEANPHPMLPSQACNGKENGGEGVRPIYLKEAARNRFISLYETRINEQIIYPATGEHTSYRRIFELQAYLMARVILGEADRYKPFMVR